MPQRATGVYIVEDDKVLRDDFALAVGRSERLHLLGATGSAREALRYLQSGPPLEVLLVDLGLPDGDGADLIRALPQHAPLARALVISVFADDWRVLDALSAGAQGYLLKDTTDDELVRAIVEVAQGDAPLSPQVARYVLRLFGPAGAPARPAPRPPGEAGDERLTPREAEILTLISRGLSGLEVAAQLKLSMHTVNTHLRSCHAKLSARNRLQAINRARESGQIG
ncbi:MAG: response regulator transcription factor [Proteobacteria bacterium]|nr:response regulator transcription factor [Pseudomonadota bacterium]